MSTQHRLTLVKKNPQQTGQLNGHLQVVREATTGRIISMLPKVWAVADRASTFTRQDTAPTVGSHRTRTRPVPEMAFYRKYTEHLLRRYMKLAMESARTPSLLGREMFHGKSSVYRVYTFDDAVHFCVDVERCLAQLQPRHRTLIKRITLQGYSQGETAAVLGLSLRVCFRQYAEALDTLTRHLLDGKILQPLKSCQGGNEVLVGVSDSPERA